MATDTDQETMTLDDAPRSATASSLAMDVPRQAVLVRRALEDEQANLKKLAEKVDDAGYPREARIVRGDAETIAEDLLPQLQSQHEIPLTSPEEFRFGVIARIRSAVRPFMRDARPGEDDPEAQCLERLASRIEEYAQDLADRAYRAGVTARSHEPAMLAFSALEALGSAE